MPVCNSPQEISLGGEIFQDSFSSLCRVDTLCAYKTVSLMSVLLYTFYECSDIYDAYSVTHDKQKKSCHVADDRPQG